LNDAQRPVLYAVGIFTSVLHGTAAKFIIKTSLFLQMFKDAGYTQTEDCLCFLADICWSSPNSI